MTLDVRHSRGSGSPPVETTCWARLRLTNATVQSTAMVVNLATKPATCWSINGDTFKRRGPCAKCGYSGCRAKIQMTARNEGTIDWTIR